MARTKLKLGLSCWGSLATQLGPEPRGLSQTATFYWLEPECLEPKKKKSAPRAEGRAARRRVSCTELGPEFPGPLQHRLMPASQQKVAGHGPAKHQLRGSSYVGKPTRSGNHFRSWCGGHKPAPKRGSALGKRREASCTRLEPGVEATTSCHWAM